MFVFAEGEEEEARVETKAEHTGYMQTRQGRRRRSWIAGVY
jgi:hypothetical protein